MCDKCQISLLQRRWMEIEVESYETGSNNSVCRPLNGVGTIFGSANMIS